MVGISEIKQQLLPLEQSLLPPLDQVEMFELHYQNGIPYLYIGDEQTFELRDFNILATSHGAEVKVRACKVGLDKTTVQWYDTIIQVKNLYVYIAK